MRCVETTNKGYVLRGLLEEVESSKGLVVMFHGFTGHMNENGYLFKELSTLLKEHGYCEFTVGVEDDNFRAIHMYQALGFDEILLRKQEEYQGDAYEYNLYLRR